MKTVRGSGSVSSSSDAEQRTSQLWLHRAGSEPREGSAIGFPPMPETCGAKRWGGHGTGGRQWIWTCLCWSGLASGCRSWAQASLRWQRKGRSLRGSGGRFPGMPRPAECARSEQCRERPTRDRARRRGVPLEIPVECRALGRTDLHLQSPSRDQRSEGRVWIAPVSRPASVPDASAHRTKGVVHILRPTAAKSMAHSTHAAPRTQGSWQRVRDNGPTLHRGADWATTGALRARLDFSGDRAEWMLFFELQKFLARPFLRNRVPSVSRLLVQSFPKVIARKTPRSKAFLLVPSFLHGRCCKDFRKNSVASTTPPGCGGSQRPLGPHGIGPSFDSAVGVPFDLELPGATRMEP